MIQLLLITDREGDVGALVMRVNSSQNQKHIAVRTANAQLKDIIIMIIFPKTVIEMTCSDSVFDSLTILCSGALSYNMLLRRRRERAYQCGPELCTCYLCTYDVWDASVRARKNFSGSC